MTGFAQVKQQSPPRDGAAAPAFTVSMKSVNHRFLDVQLRLPADTDALEMKLRRLLKEKMARGHVELTLSLDRGAAEGVGFNRQLVSSYVAAFRAAAAEFSLNAEPDLNVIFRTPGALSGSADGLDEVTQNAIVAAAEEAVAKLNAMREHEGQGIARELRDTMQRLRAATEEIARLRSAVLNAHYEKLRTRMKEFAGAQVADDRILQEAALLAERGDIQEEIVRMNTHIDHFLGLLDEGREVGKKLDFLLQEMNRESNTLLSKTQGVVGEALRLTELGLEMKSQVEKAREQAQNIE